MKALCIVSFLFLAGCTSTSLVVPIDNPGNVRIEIGKGDKDCQPVIVNGKSGSESGCEK